MIVAICFAIVAAGTVAKIYLVNQSGFLQVTQGVVNRCVTDTGQSVAGRFEDVAGSRVVVTLLDDLKDRLSLRRQLRFWLCFLHDGFRLILNRRFVNRGHGCRGSKPRILFGEVYDSIDVGFEGWAADAVWHKEFLGLGGFVELFDEEIWDCVMR